MTPKELEKLYKSISKFDQHLGMTFDLLDPGEVVYKMTVKEEHLSSPDTCHGGAIAAMMDALLGVPVLSLAVTEDKLCATVEFKINYLGPAQIGDELVGTNTIDFKGKSLVVSSGQIKNSQTGLLIAKGMGTFNLYPAKKKDFFNVDKPKK
ncbi:MAG: PaaI family thioesterase [Bacteriovoracaceae bacterium]|nr:PaaI family thioesterase [Bacteriovoracaceae bacterium]